jgi:hypothetical protein
MSLKKIDHKLVVLLFCLLLTFVADVTLFGFDLLGGSIAFALQLLGGVAFVCFVITRR